jgi:hypothetical protein
MRDLSLCINLLKSATVKAKLKKQCSFGSISYQVAPSGVEVMSGKGYQAMQSRIPVFNEIMNALKAGERGLSKQAIEDKLFDKMVIASVTRNPDIIKIQGRIADQLGLTFNEESEWGRAGRLRERLKQEKKILVVLDDLRKRLDLEAIGISFKDMNKMNAKCCRHRENLMFYQVKWKLIKTSQLVV